MTPGDAVSLIQSGGVIACLILIIWAILTRRVIVRGEFDRLEAEYQHLKKAADAATDELRSQAATNARLVELAFAQRQEAEDIRRRP